MGIARRNGAPDGIALEDRSGVTGERDAAFYLSFSKARALRNEFNASWTLIGANERPLCRSWEAAVEMSPTRGAVRGQLRSFGGILPMPARRTAPDLRRQWPDRWRAGAPTV